MMKKIIILLPILFLLSCSETNVIELGDKVKKCVVDSIVIHAPISTIQFEPTIDYYTDCGQKITTHSKHSYRIGDTVTFVYKKRK